MGRLEEDSVSPNPSTSVYPEQLQLKLYQAFIFSIPILFSIILFLLFYLFYLKRRALSLSSHPPPTHQSYASNPSSFLSPPWNLGIKGEPKDKLNVVLFDEKLRARDSLCCVCLGEFEMKEELRQLPFCRHVFHGDCIRHWLRANATCPLCRHPVISTSRTGLPVGLGLGLDPTLREGSENYAWQEEQGNVRSSSNNTNISTSRPEEHVIQIAEEPSFNTSNS